MDETIEALRAQHASLDDQLNEEIRRPLPDQLAISQIKREKLRIKDRIAELERSTSPRV
ncbi:MAG: YdcH family protein [Alphaproteobacteria bacterium]